ncbi:PIG-F-domain-containing protein [Tricholoma matsutake]|nr:PIG-F-domain-containing protein [Tricholoma matsutake 945]
MAKGRIPDSIVNAGFFPFARYASIVGVHTTLLTFTALFLPRTTFLLEFTTPSPDEAFMSSRDRPQHPFLVPLTLSPTSTLLCICAGVLVLQSWWGGWVRNWAIEYTLVGSDDEKRLDKSLMQKQRMTGLRNAWVMTITASFVLHVVLILFGASLTSHGFQTYLLALLISLLVVFTPGYTLSPPSFGSDTLSVVRRMTWVRLFAECSIRTPIERAMVYPAIGTVVGCWLGVIPIALDWDRPWQAWPLTPAFGAILGYILASMYALTTSAVGYLADVNDHLLHPKKTN